MEWIEESAQRRNNGVIGPQHVNVSDIINEARLAQNIQWQTIHLILQEQRAHRLRRTHFVTSKANCKLASLSLVELHDFYIHPVIHDY